MALPKGTMVGIRLAGPGRDTVIAAVRGMKMNMVRRAFAVVALLALVLGSVVPSSAASGGGGRGGGGMGGGGHMGGGHRGGGGWHGGHHGCCWSGTRVFIGGGFGAYPWWGYPYPAYGYPYAYPYAYSYPAYAAPAAQPAVAYQQPPLQREVVFPNGKYVLYGDGMTQPWQWVWFNAAPPPAPSSPPQ